MSGLKGQAGMGKAYIYKNWDGQWIYLSGIGYFNRKFAHWDDAVNHAISVFYGRNEDLNTYISDYLKTEGI